MSRGGRKMLKEKWKKAKSLITTDDGKGSKKKIENLVVLLIILVITILAINAIWKGDDKEKNNSNKEPSTEGKYLAQEQYDTEEVVQVSAKADLKTNLEEILMQINGVGKVSVLVTYSESSQTVAMYNENTKETSTEEKDTSGGTRLIKESDTQKDVIYEEENGVKKPIIQKTIMPKIEGAIITAEGASDGNIKANIIQAVEAVTGLATHKIQVFEMKR